MLYKATLTEHLAEAYAADPFFADEARTATRMFSGGLWWKDDRIVMPNSVDCKRLLRKLSMNIPWLGTLVLPRPGRLSPVASTGQMLTGR